MDEQEYSGLEPDPESSMHMYLGPQPPFIWYHVMRVPVMGNFAKLVAVPLFTSN